MNRTRARVARIRQMCESEPSVTCEHCGKTFLLRDASKVRPYPRSNFSFIEIEVCPHCHMPFEYDGDET